MIDHGRRRARPRGARARLAGALLAAALLLPALPRGSAIAKDHPAFQARAGLDLARAAAAAWAADAELVYVENDEHLDETGSAPRWGYLFHSPGLGQSRIYSVRDGRILVAENLAMRFEAPPLAGDWIDSGAALAAAGRAVEREFRRGETPRLSTMLLMRGAFQDADPDPTTWTLIYTAPGAPSLFVMVDATEGKVRRTWRG
jgi:hypothetical protein